jgi:DNA-binding CsgD family transcriptional regulator
MLGDRERRITEEIAMPGGRLTQQERQQIALGLADGLPYAEIARRLDRPTSTITREVMRNGGPTAYRADLAHRATERRAHRRRQAAPGGGVLPQPHGRDAEAVREYEETFTTLLMPQGLPKMTARVLTCLFTTDAGSLTASELVQRLQVSPASVSKAIAFLESQGLVRRERDERRRERYVVDDDVWYQSTIASARGQRPARRDRTPGRRHPRPATPRPPPAWRTSPASSTSSAKSITRAAEQARESSTPNPPGPSPWPSTACWDRRASDRCWGTAGSGRPAAARPHRAVAGRRAR